MLKYIADYENIDLQVVTSGILEASLPALLPASSGGTVLNPEKIFVQAATRNADSIFIGKTGVLSNGTTGAFELAPGASIYLPCHTLATWKHITTLANQVLYVTYLSKGY